MAMTQGDRYPRLARYIYTEGSHIQGKTPASLSDEDFRLEARGGLLAY